MARPTSRLPPDGAPVPSTSTHSNSPRKSAGAAGTAFGSSSPAGVRPREATQCRGCSAISETVKPEDAQVAVAGDVGAEDVDPALEQIGHLDDRVGGGVGHDLGEDQERGAVLAGRLRGGRSERRRHTT